MKGTHLRLFVLERQRHGRLLLYEWLLKQARKMNISGGAAFREIAGYGRRNRLHAEYFFELAGDLPIEVVFVMTNEQADHFLKLLESEKLSIFYIMSRAEYGHTGER